MDIELFVCPPVSSGRKYYKQMYVVIKNFNCNECTFT